MPTTTPLSAHRVFRDFTSGIVVFFVALPLCLGIALASGAPLVSGILAGIIGGVVIGLISGSHTSVSGPAAGLTAVVAAEIAYLGSFEAFLVAVVMAGILQIAFGICRGGFFAEYVPTSVIKGLLAAIGIILILKQLPHLVGHDADPEGDMSFWQLDQENTFTELWRMIFDLHPGAMVVGLGSVLILISWKRLKWISGTGLPAALVVVLVGIVATLTSRYFGAPWEIQTAHLVNVPTPEKLSDLLGYIRLPDWTVLENSRVYTAALTLAIVATLETLINLEAADRIDSKQRVSPPNRELIAQGLGNTVAGLMGGLPMTSVIIRTSVNIQTGNETKLSTVVHGGLLLFCVALVPSWLNLIPLSCLAAILIVTGIKLASISIFREMWKRGTNQFLPFVVTVLAIVFTDLLIGLLIGLATSIAFILHSNLLNPLRTIVEKHVGDDVLRVELGSQVSFLNRASLQRTLNSLQKGQHVLIDARSTIYMDPDVEDLLLDFDHVTGPARGVHVSLLGFSEDKPFRNRIRFADTANCQVQQSCSPRDVINILREGNNRFLTGQRLTRDFGRQQALTAEGQYPLAVVLSCIDSRTPAELVFDLGLGDIFSIRVAGNVAKDKVLGSMEYGCAVAGAKLVMVMGHTRCGAVRAAVDFYLNRKDPIASTGCQHIDAIVREIQRTLTEEDRLGRYRSQDEVYAFADEIAKQNVLRTVRQIRNESETIERLVRDNKIIICGAMYDVSTGSVDIFETMESQFTASAN